MPTLSDAIRVAKTTRNSVNYWVAGGFLSTAFLPTTAGVARNVTRENALEIAFMAALTSVGVPPSIATSTVLGWLEQERRGKLFDFSVRPHGEPGISIEFADESSFDYIATLLGGIRTGTEIDSGVPVEPATVFSVINVRAIVLNVDRLFSGDDATYAPNSERSR